MNRLSGITRLLARERASLAEALDDAPLAVDNVLGAYDPVHYGQQPAHAGYAQQGHAAPYAQPAQPQQEAYGQGQYGQQPYGQGQYGQEAYGQGQDAHGQYAHGQYAQPADHAAPDASAGAAPPYAGYGEQPAYVDAQELIEQTQDGEDLLEDAELVDDETGPHYRTES